RLQDEVPPLARALLLPEHLGARRLVRREGKGKEKKRKEESESSSHVNVFATVEYRQLSTVNRQPNSGARGRTRTGTPLRITDFESVASAYFATRAVAFCSCHCATAPCSSASVSTRLFDFASWKISLVNDSSCGYPCSASQ